MFSNQGLFKRECMADHRPAILIVDDKPSNLLALEALLEDLDVSVVRAESGFEAIEKSEAINFALILLDVHMPEMDGFETAERLRSGSLNQSTPIIFVTAVHMDKGHIFRGYESGAVDYLFKPIDPQIFNSKVKVFVELARRREELEKSRSLLAESETKYRLLVENAHDAVFIVQQGKIKFCNRHTEELTGRTQEELEKVDFSYLFTPDSRGPLEHLHTPVDDSSEPEVQTLRMSSATGDEIWCDVIAKETTYNNFPARIFFLRNITQRRKLEKKLFQSQKLEAIGTLAGGIAHDFNNILGGIIGYSELSLHDRSLNDNLRRNLMEVLNAANRAKDLVRQILTFSRRQSQNKQPVMLEPLVKEVLKLLTASLPKNIRIISKIRTTSCLIYSDPSEIQQLTVNLCTNAAQAMENQGGELSVGIESVDLNEPSEEFPELAPGPYVRLFVHDSGPGIDPEHIKHIFEPYFTTKNKTNEKGVGLGLAVVHGIVVSHNGAITVKRSSDNGAAFEIMLPRIVVNKPSLVSTPPPPEQGKKAKIMFIDDESILRMLGKKMLKHLGYETDVYANPQEALEQYKLTPKAYALIITDYSMKEMNGDTLTEEILKVNPSQPVIICTGYSDKMNEERALSLGARSLMLKPVSLQQLKIAVDNVLAPSSALKP